MYDPENPAANGLVAQIVFGSEPISGLVIIVETRLYVEHFRLSRAIYFSRRKTYLQFRLSYARDFVGPQKNISGRLDFLRDFRTEIVRGNTL